MTELLRTDCITWCHTTWYVPLGTVPLGMIQFGIVPFGITPLGSLLSALTPEGQQSTWQAGTDLQDASSCCLMNQAAVNLLEVNHHTSDVSIWNNNG